MSYVFKAEEIYKKIPADVKPNKPLVELRGLYVAGTYRPPYFIDHVLNLTHIGSVGPADVKRFSTETASSYEQSTGILRINDVNITDPSVVIYTTAVDKGYEESKGILRISDVFMDSPTVISYTSAQSDSYEQKIGLLRISDVTLTDYSVINIPIVINTQPPGDSVLQINAFSSTTAEITRNQS